LLSSAKSLFAHAKLACIQLTPLILRRMRAMSAALSLTNAVEQAAM
jgi:hypothetical protein